MRFRRLTVVVGVLSAATLAAPGVAVAGPARRPLPPTPVIDVQATAKQSVVTGRLDRRPGLVTVRVHAIGGEREVNVVSLHPGYSRAQFVADSTRYEAGSLAALRVIERSTDKFGGVDVQSGATETATIALPPGIFYLYGVTNGRLETHRITVAGPEMFSRPPVPDAVAVLRDTSITGPATLPRTGHLLIADGDAGSHLVCLDSVRPGTTLREVRDFVRDPSGPPPFTGVQGCTTTLSPGHVFDYGYSRPAGRYLMFDPLPDLHTGSYFLDEGALHLVNLY
jgi:hypothetical protein